MSWERNDIQFPRLLAEIVATQADLDIPGLATSMDLTAEQVNELFDRAQSEWEKIKVEGESYRDKTVPAPDGYCTECGAPLHGVHLPSCGKRAIDDWTVYLEDCEDEDGDEDCNDEHLHGVSRALMEAADEGDTDEVRRIATLLSERADDDPFPDDPFDEDED